MCILILPFPFSLLLSLSLPSSSSSPGGRSSNSNGKKKKQKKGEGDKTVESDTTASSLPPAVDDESTIPVKGGYKIYTKERLAKFNKRTSTPYVAIMGESPSPPSTLLYSPDHSDPTLRDAFTPAISTDA